MGSVESVPVTSGQALFVIISSFTAHHQALLAIGSRKAQRKMRTRGVAALVAAALCCLVSVHAQSSRLVEKELNFAVHREHLEGDVPLIDPPKRIAGYFKLNR